jgi:putative ABC transport system permease protein
MLTSALHALLSHWVRKPFQLATLLLGLSLATALWSGVKAINAEAEASYAQAASALGEDQLPQLLRSDSALFDQQVFIDLCRAGWLVSPVIEGDVQFGPVKLRLLGVDPVSMPPQASRVATAGNADLLSFIAEAGLIYANAETVLRLAGQKTPPLRILATVPPGTLIADIGHAQTLLKAEGKLSRLLMWKNQSTSKADLKTVAPNLVTREPSQNTDIGRLTDSFHLNLTAFGYLSFVVGLFIVYSAIGLAFEQRRPVFRTLRALGLSARALIFILVAELLVMALISGVIGVAMGYGVASLLLPNVAATLRGLYGVDVPGTLSFRPSWWLAGIVIAVMGTLVSAAQNLWQVWNLPILATAQPRAWAKETRRTLRLQGIAALLLLSMALVLAKFGSGLSAGFAILGTMLLGAAFALPLILAGLLKLAGNLARGPIATWFWADTRQQLSGQSMALMALLLALATNVGVGTMVSSFRLTFTGYLDQRLASELYVSGRTEAEADAMRTWLLPRSTVVLPIWTVDDKVGIQPAQIFGVKDHETYRNNWPMLSAIPDVWNKIANGQGALINEQLSRREHLSLGDQITLAGGWNTNVVGIYSDYGNPVGQVIVGVDQLVLHYPDVERLRYAVRIDPQKAFALANDLRTQFDLPQQNVVNQADLKKFSLNVFERTFSVTAALNILTLGVAGIAMFASLMTLAEMRLPQLAPVWAMGLTRKNLAWLEFCRSVLLAIFTMIAALPLGLALAWVLLTVVNTEAFGWRLPMYVFPREWAWLGLLGLLASALAAAMPVRRLALSAPSDLLKVFANER